MRFSTAITGVAAFSGLVAAHPGADIKAEIAERAEFLKHIKRADISHCASKLKARGVERRAIARRQAAVKNLAKKSKPSIKLETSHDHPLVNHFDRA